MMERNDIAVTGTRLRNAGSVIAGLIERFRNSPPTTRDERSVPRPWFRYKPGLLGSFDLEKSQEVTENVFCDDAILKEERLSRKVPCCIDFETEEPLLNPEQDADENAAEDMRAWVETPEIPKTSVNELPEKPETIEEPPLPAEPPNDELPETIEEPPLPAEAPNDELPETIEEPPLPNDELPETIEEPPLPAEAPNDELPETIAEPPKDELPELPETIEEPPLPAEPPNDELPETIEEPPLPAEPPNDELPETIEEPPLPAEEEEEEEEGVRTCSFSFTTTALDFCSTTMEICCSVDDQPLCVQARDPAVSADVLSVCCEPPADDSISCGESATENSVREPPPPELSSQEEEEEEASPPPQEPPLCCEQTVQTDSVELCVSQLQSFLGDGWSCRKAQASLEELEDRLLGKLGAIRSSIEQELASKKRRNFHC